MAAKPKEDLTGSFYCAAGLMTGGTGVFLPAQQASRRRSLPVNGLPPALPGGYLPGAQQLNHLQVGKVSKAYMHIAINILPVMVCSKLASFGYLCDHISSPENSTAQQQRCFR